MLFVWACYGIIKSIMKLVFSSLEKTQEFAHLVGEKLRGGEILELAGDVGTGKTTFTKGLAAGLSIDDDVQSPSFTISRTYTCPNGLELHHYDFYRLTEPGIMRHDVAESAASDWAVTVVEWGETVGDVLPEKRTKLYFSYGEGETERILKIASPCPAVQEAYAAWV